MRVPRSVTRTETRSPISPCSGPTYATRSTRCESLSARRTHSPIGRPATVIRGLTSTLWAAAKASPGSPPPSTTAFQRSGSPVMSSRVAPAAEGDRAPGPQCPVSTRPRPYTSASSRTALPRTYGQRRGSRATLLRAWLSTGAGRRRAAKASTAGTIRRSSVTPSSGNAVGNQVDRAQGVQQGQRRDQFGLGAGAPVAQREQQRQRVLPHGAETAKRREGAAGGQAGLVHTREYAQAANKFHKKAANLFPAVGGLPLQELYNSSSIRAGSSKRFLIVTRNCTASLPSMMR